MGQRLTPDHPGLKKIQTMLDKHFSPVRKEPLRGMAQFEGKPTLDDVNREYATLGKPIDPVHKTQGLILDNLDKLTEGRTD